MISLLPGISDHYCRPSGDISALLAAGQSDSEIDVNRRARIREQFYRARGARFNAKTQPRAGDGRFRKILARLKQNLGDSELEQISAEIDKADKANDAGDYAKASEAARAVTHLIDEIDEGTIDPELVSNLRAGNRELGRVMAYLPLPQGKDTAKVRFSDLPPSTAKFIQGMIDRIQDKINADDAEKFTSVLRSYMSGGRTMTADEISSELAKLLKLLS